MLTSSSRRVQFIGEGLLPEFDFSQEPLPESIRILLWMLDGAERRHRLATKMAKSRWPRPSRRSEG